MLTADIHFVVPTNPAAQYPYTNLVSAATNIQNAVNAATANDTVLVSSGLYSLTTQVTINKGILLTTEEGAEKTVITAQSSGRCVYLAHASAILDGFTVTGGDTNNGGGIYINVNGMIRNCTITSNSADFGGGIYCNSNGVINRCVISHNTASLQGGGANFFVGGEMSDCLVVHNSADLSFGGGVVLRKGGIGSDTNTPGAIVVCWQSSSNRLYTLRHNTNLLATNSWTNITELTLTNGTGSSMSFTNSLPTRLNFYRIKASLKP